MIPISIIPVSEFERLGQAPLDWADRLSLIADMCRANALATVKRAGSGHLGSSFSSLDIVTLLYYRTMNTGALGVNHPDRDVYFSSKGHDVPGLYAVLYSLGILPRDQFARLRRLGGTCGHPDVSTPGVEANSGSLGMGISKAKGIAIGKRLTGRAGRVFVMTGDGELQEGQNFEALQAAAHQRVGRLTVIVDHNKVQSDRPVRDILDLGNLEEKLKAFGWHVGRTNGHDLHGLDRALAECLRVDDRPSILIADTIKGRGVSFMEHPTALRDGGGLYRWHAGAPPDEAFLAAHREILDRVNERLRDLGVAPVGLEPIEAEDRQRPGGGGQVGPSADVDHQAADTLLAEPSSLRGPAGPLETPGARPGAPARVTDEYVAQAFGEALVDLAERRPDLVVLDADLSADCRLRAFEQRFPDRFIENGIAEQDMVSTAGGLALQGLLPIVNTFGAFLTARANEQIYNNACERTRIIYVCHYAGLIPAGPGQSHQSVRDISLVAALPNFVVLQPANAAETRAALQYAVEETADNCVLRLAIGPSPRRIEMPADTRLVLGVGRTLREGTDAVLIAYGPVMLHEALTASERLAEQGFGLQVVNMPWLNRIDAGWLIDTIGARLAVYVLEDHAPVGGLADRVLEVLAETERLNGKSFKRFGIEGYPLWGTPAEVLRAHRVDARSLAERITAAVRV